MQQHHGEKSSEQVNPPLYTPEQVCRHFGLAEIRLATQDFADALILGRGGFGYVYQGQIDNGASTVAIKRLNSMSKQGAVEFRTEIELLSAFRHCHLVSLIGYCDESDEMILVYEYMSNGTLYDQLHKVGKNGNSPLSWVQRLQICMGSARGLDYLHTGTGIQHRVIHRDVKSSNILLDENWAAKVSDFGLSKIGPANQSCSYVSTDVKGTYGYLDPEYFSTCRLTSKTDVYAFGVVLFEVLAGRPAVDSRLAEEQHSLAAWARRCVKEGKIDRIMDPSLRDEQVCPKSLKKFVKIADQCLRRNQEERPTMAQVVVCLQFALKLQEIWGSALVEGETLQARVTTGEDGCEKLSVVNSKESGGEVQNDIHQKKQEDGQMQLRAARPGTGMAINAKRLRQEGFQGHKEWLMLLVALLLAVSSLNGLGNNVEPLELQAEINYLGQLSHPNLVKLVGYCLEDEHRLLVYEFTPRCKVDNHLFRREFFLLGAGSSYFQPLSWNLRMRVALGAAKGLAYLHSPEAKVICMFKSSNILIDSDYNAKLSGFELAKDRSDDRESDVLPQLMGTYDYAAPEYLATGHLTARSDVYSFGVVLLEMLTGRRAVDTNRPQGEHNLVMWAKPCLTSKRKIFKVMDARIEGQYSLVGAVKAATIAVKCLSTEPKLRPSMVEVVEALEQLQDLKDYGSVRSESVKRHPLR
ncbi:hypothetical protein RJ640_009341 [Escallonia rubra]|uniref:Protein kinase domain-containing protein n=1 Tax=Escallonia rubra TaxID=112253 RepID=A0AA88U0C3_9ASTE|nr:hypothetical protein RJ640_009341 [Escallonia rubra]